MGWPLRGAYSKRKIMNLPTCFVKIQPTRVPPTEFSMGAIKNVPLTVKQAVEHTVSLSQLSHTLFREASSASLPVNRLE